jgi:hypothetical protein
VSAGHRMIHLLIYTAYSEDGLNPILLVNRPSPWKDHRQYAPTLCEPGRPLNVRIAGLSPHLNAPANVR